jgi:hypothetical protein
MVGHEMDEAKDDFLIANRADREGILFFAPCSKIYNISE